MINLLPPEIKTNYRYGRRNIVLRRWAVAFLVAVVGLGALTTYGLLSLQQSTKHYNKEVADSQAYFAKADFAGTQKQLQDISSSFKLVVKVLGQEVLFSQVIKQLAATLPPQASLTGLDLSGTQGGIDISAIAPDYNTATQVQVNLSDPTNKLFSKADIVSVSCKSDANTDPRFPCTVKVRALFASNNPFLFINQKVAGA